MSICAPRAQESQINCLVSSGLDAGRALQLAKYRIGVNLFAHSVFECQHMGPNHLSPPKCDRDYCRFTAVDRLPGPDGIQQVH